VVSTLGPQIIRRDAEPTRTAGSGTQVWDLVAKQEDGHDLLLAYTEFPPGVSVGPHVRNYDEFIFYVSGEAEVEDVGTGKVYSLSSTESILIPAGVEHIHRNVGTDRLRQFYVRSAKLPLE